MRIHLVYPPAWIERRPLPPAGIATLTAGLRRVGHDVIQTDMELICWQYNHKAARPRRVRLDLLTDYQVVRPHLLGQPENLHLAESLARIERLVTLDGFDLTGFSIMSWAQLVSALAIANNIKKKLATNVVLGGAYMDFEAKQVMERFSFVDYVMNGEAWCTLPLLVEAIQEKSGLADIPGLVYRSGDQVELNNSVVESIDEMPPPEYEGLPFVAYRQMMNNCYRINAEHIVLRYLLGTGCPFKCNFCRRNVGIPLRFKSPTKVASELKYLSLRFNTNLFVLDCSEVNPSSRYAESLADSLVAKETDVLWYSYATPKDLSKRVLEKLYAGGCRMLRLGIESGSQRVLDRMDKPVQVDEMANILKNSSNSGIWNQINLIIGYPYETRQDVQETMEFIENNHEFINDARLHLFYPHKHSDFYQKAQERGVLISRKDGSLRIDELEGLKWREKKNFVSEAIELVGKTLLRYRIGFSGIATNLTFLALVRFRDRDAVKDWLTRRHPQFFQNDSTHALRWILYHAEEKSLRPFPKEWINFFCWRPQRLVHHDVY